MDPASTLQAVREWPVSDRLELVYRLWDQLLEDGCQPAPSDDLVAELERRLEAHEANPSNVRTWEQVLNRLRKGGKA